MDSFDEEIFNLWAALQSCGVKYIMVGGFAANLHGYQRYTGDIDIWLEDTLENKRRLRQVFVQCGMHGDPVLETTPFVTGRTGLHLLNGLRVDIIVSMNGLEGYTFDECLHMAAVADIDNVQVPFLHIHQLIANKKAVNRPKDQLDVIALERIQKML